ncbi:BgTH12-02115 [Blumeria graminis f. sp. triticale]|uniref:BgTH12-02115 n=1 Tax=Blumeria graminis f. sp. triticale TaxID=1689686 RepID=A0A9W4DHJ2_BLUGR|nr:BgTH12-02115 [Blumeria graminis f. sp. triticale]
MVYRESLSADSTLSLFDTEVTAVKEALKNYAFPTNSTLLGKSLDTHR